MSNYKIKYIALAWLFILTISTKAYSNDVDSNIIKDKIDIYSLQHKTISKFCGSKKYANGNPLLYNPYSTVRKCFIANDLSVIQVIDKHNVLVKYAFGINNQTGILYFNSNPPAVGDLITGFVIGLRTKRYNEANGSEMVAPVFLWKGSFDLQSYDQKLELLQKKLKKEELLGSPSKIKAILVNYAKDINDKISNLTAEGAHQNQVTEVKLTLYRSGYIKNEKFIEKSNSHNFNFIFNSLIGTMLQPPQNLPYRFYKHIYIEAKVLKFRNVLIQTTLGSQKEQVTKKMLLKSGDQQKEKLLNSIYKVIVSRFKTNFKDPVFGKIACNVTVNLTRNGSSYNPSIVCHTTNAFEHTQLHDAVRKALTAGEPYKLTPGEPRTIQFQFSDSKSFW